MAANSDTQSRVVALRLEQSLAERVERAAEADQRTIGNAVRLLVIRGLGEYEREVMGAASADGRPAKEVSL